MNEAAVRMLRCITDDLRAQGWNWAASPVGTVTLYSPDREVLYYANYTDEFPRVRRYSGGSAMLIAGEATFTGEMIAAVHTLLVEG
jgi:hypothetical protein